jgi:hypothetical protein
MRRGAIAIAMTASLSGGAAGAQTLRDAIDLHAHYAPDLRPRRDDADPVSIARAARDAGMRAVVLKNAEAESVSMAFLARAEVPGIDVFGGVVLDRQVGGLNPAIVDYVATLKHGCCGRIVWMPTTDAENAVRASGEQRPFVPIARDGALLPATEAVLDAIARNHLVLATGHSSAREVLLLTAAARRRGIRGVVVTHEMQGPVDMDLAQLRAAAADGAYLEFVVDGLFIAGQHDFAAEMHRYAAMIRAVGVEHFVLSSDLGQAENPDHEDGLLALYGALRAEGFSLSEIHRMAAENPARLLGLPPLPPSPDPQAKERP